ncbi:MAG: PEP/pyruvate-binding domain-containing protein [Planctomycetota bacterium]|jgi:CheY-like chemotaxis protein|nr:PEP/pyruvate-binding domain-containing protein [Planctomycetota bacterium]MDP6761374.1 PEP/pyruvate-binding domain-containing protein [Planctomycetota bacterium]MDP6987843.1 PEP/pyruvate-binding domain-containing protein [Planctomycetota bacterium]
MTKESERSGRHAAARLRSFHELMRHRVKRILLVSSVYDSFVMSEEGHLAEALLSQFIDFDRSSIPDVVQVASGAEVLELLEEGNSFDLVVSSLETTDCDAVRLTNRLREAGFDLPVIALAFSPRELHEFVTDNDTSELERIFLWQGDVRVFLAMVMYLEDRLNVANDTSVHGVPAIIVVEDSVRYYSSFLPTIYAELFRHTQRLLSEELNLSQRMIRMRARPKVLLSDTYEEAWEYFERYGEYVIGIVSDFEYPRGGRLEKLAGLDLCRRALAERKDVRLVLQSSRPENREQAEELGASFLVKGSPFLLQDLRKILVGRFGFGDFIFRDLSGDEVDRAEDLKSLAKKIASVPAESFAYHAGRNHFSKWLKARTEFALAERLVPRGGEDETDPEDLRRHFLALIEEYRQERDRTVIADFDRKRFEPSVSITRIGAGSLGGKARGVAFANKVLVASGVGDRFEEIDIGVPPCVALGTEVFEEFLAYGRIHEFAMGRRPDEEIIRLFLQAPFPRAAGSDLRAFLQHAKHPLAVRSSSLMEDSLSQPFAGIYRTIMLPNSASDLDLRLMQLTDAIKRVYASTFSEKAKTYLSVTSHRLEEERMAVMVQELVGERHEERFYPDFAGVARSHNFYPEPGQAAEDGVCAVALGLGRTVVGGDPCLRFCPEYPQRIVGFSTVDDALQNSQREFFALDLSRVTPRHGEVELERFPLELAERDGPLSWLGSTYTADDHRIVDGISRAGVRLVTFAQILKHGAFPLPELLSELLARSAEGTGAPVEIEFAGNLGRPGRRPRFAFLQLRPMALSKEGAEVEIGEPSEEELVCRSHRVLGNGRLDGLRDVVVVDRSRFDRQRTWEVAGEVAALDATLRARETPYVLVGLGRWGSADPSLGIPVTWNQIAGARVIVETGFEDLRVAPSQGTHFFQNLTSCHVGYFTVNPDLGDGLLAWDWLSTVDAESETTFLRHLRLDAPLVVKMDGRTGDGVILKG